VRAVKDQFHGDLLEVSMGRSIRRRTGVFRMVATLDGEQLVKLKPVFGYLHRNHEKIAENTTYLGSMPYTDRLDYLCSMSTNWAYALAVEKTFRSGSPDRAQYLRIIMAELTRLVNHACLVGFLFNDLGTRSPRCSTPSAMREKILDLFESLSGSRMMCNYQRFGGCRVDPSPEWLETARGRWRISRGSSTSTSACSRATRSCSPAPRGIGRLDGSRAINAGLTGPVLRASGVDYDVRKVDGYGFYPRFAFRVPLGEHGDCYDRYMLRILEMRESVKILVQAFHDLPPGPSWTRRRRSAASAPRPARPTAASRARRANSASTSSATAARIPTATACARLPSSNLTLLEEMCLGHTIADAVVILGSIDIVLGEVDR